MGLTNQSTHPGVARLRELIREAVDADGQTRKPYEVYVYTFGDEKDPAGVRVAEVGIGDERGGASWMRVDDSAAPVILACEEVLLGYTDDANSIMVHDGFVGGKYDPSIYDPEQEAAQRLRYAVGGEAAQKPWEHRFPPDWRHPDHDTLDWYDPEKQAAYEANLGAGA